MGARAPWSAIDFDQHTAANFESFEMPQRSDLSRDVQRRLQEAVKAQQSHVEAEREAGMDKARRLLETAEPDDAKTVLMAVFNRLVGPFGAIGVIRCVYEAWRDDGGGRV